MRLLIITLFLTFVWYNQSQGAPNNLPKMETPKINLEKTSEITDEIEPVKSSLHQAQLGYLVGNIYSSEEQVSKVFLGYGRKVELDFEQYFLLGAFSDISHILGLYGRTPLQNFDYFKNTFYSDIEIGLIHFIDANDGISNLVNINHTKISIGYTFYNLLSLQGFAGSYGAGVEAHLSWGF